MKVTTGSGAAGPGRVLGVNNGRGAGFVFGMYKSNTTGSSAVPSSAGVDIATGHGLTRKCSRQARSGSSSDDHQLSAGALWNVGFLRVACS
jgi:hypothetical protein